VVASPRAALTVRLLGLVFAGTATDHRDEMTRFVREVLGLRRVDIGGVEADMFALPDGSHFAVAEPRGMGDTDRSIGFRVEKLDEAVADLRAAGLEVGDPAENDRQRYVHFRAPDGKLYELVEDR
jgi:catechol 2,3-dioxygenase-like lactoylglutathione lyase family enzyme